jgi:methanogenic corrinoid protein MtbC1
MEPLLGGHRQECRRIVRDALAEGVKPNTIYHEVFWPTMVHLDGLYREDRINIAVEHMATRITRSLADQLQAHLPPCVPNGRKIIIACADDEPEELGAQMLADLFEADGWMVYFLGGGVPNDEILPLVGEHRPDILMVYGSKPRGVPGVRQLIDLLADVGVHPTMNVMISGGVFNRADGLWEEIQADLFAPTAAEALEVARDSKPKVPVPRKPGVPKKRRRRRRPPLLVQSEAAQAAQTAKAT